MLGGTGASEECAPGCSIEIRPRKKPAYPYGSTHYLLTGETTCPLRPSLGRGLNLFDRVAPVVRGDVVWLIVTDEFDVNYVVRARMTPADGSPS